MKSHLSRKSEKLSYVVNALDAASNAIVTPLLLAVFIPLVEQIAIPMAMLFQSAISWWTNKGFADNARTPNNFGKMLSFTRCHLMTVMIADVIITLALIYALYKAPTLGYIILPLERVLDAFVSQIALEDVNSIFNADTDAGAFRTYYTNENAKNTTKASFVGNGVSVVITTTAMVSIEELTIMLALQCVVVNIALVLRRLSLRDDAANLQEHER